MNTECVATTQQVVSRTCKVGNKSMQSEGIKKTFCFKTLTFVQKLFQAKSTCRVWTLPQEISLLEDFKLGSPNLLWLVVSTLARAPYPGLQLDSTHLAPPKTAPEQEDQESQRQPKIDTSGVFTCVTEQLQP